MTDMITSPATERGASHLSPFMPIGWLRAEIDRLFEDFGRPPRSLFDHFQKEPGLPVAIEMTETEKDYRVAAEVPGLDEKDVEITLDDGLLSISGTKRDERQVEGNGVVVSERRYGGFQRQIRVPADVDAEKISAAVQRGVLTITLPKDAVASRGRRKIEIGKD